METTALQTLWLGLMLYVLYETSAVYSYISSRPMRLFKWWTKIHLYDSRDGLSYSDWLTSKYPKSFLYKLLSCRYCFGLWLAFGICMTTNSPEETPIVYFLGQSICSLFNLSERMMRDA